MSLDLKSAVRVSSEWTRSFSPLSWSVCAFMLDSSSVSYSDDCSFSLESFFLSLEFFEFRDVLLVEGFLADFFLKAEMKEVILFSFLTFLFILFADAERDSEDVVESPGWYCEVITLCKAYSKCCLTPVSLKYSKPLMTLRAEFV